MTASAGAAGGGGGERGGGDSVAARRVFTARERANESRTGGKSWSKLTGRGINRDKDRCHRQRPAASRRLTAGLADWTRLAWWGRNREDSGAAKSFPEGGGKPVAESLGLEKRRIGREFCALVAVALYSSILMPNEVS